MYSDNMGSAIIYLAAGISVKFKQIRLDMWQYEGVQQLSGAVFVLPLYIPQ